MHQLKWSEREKKIARAVLRLRCNGACRGHDPVQSGGRARPDT